MDYGNAYLGRLMSRLAFCTLLPVGILAQGELSRPVLTAGDFIRQVGRYHPVSRQAALLLKRGDAALLAAKGNFDPSVSASASRKTFDGKNYYAYNNASLDIPLPVGSIVGGVEDNGGTRLSPEVTSGVSSYLGVEVPLANGLLLDKRRAALRSAKLFRSQSEQERLVLLNDLFLQAYTAYFNWAAAYYQHQIYNTYLNIAENRLRLVKIGYSLGDRPLMDTIEAFAQQESYRLAQSDALLKLNNTRLELENFLWRETLDLPATLTNYVPDSLGKGDPGSFSSAEEMVNTPSEAIPGLAVYQYKLNMLEIDRLLKRQSLLPYFSMKANLLNKGQYPLKGISTGLIENNYKWGVEVRVPLFLRQARGNYRESLIKLEEARIEYAGKRRQTENKIQSYYNEWRALNAQVATTETMLASYELLLKGEKLKFEQGESALFLVNSREGKVVEMRQKKIELAAKCFKAKYALEWATGRLANLVQDMKK